VTRRLIALALALVSASCTGTPEPVPAPSATTPRPGPTFNVLNEWLHVPEGAEMAPGRYLNREFNPDVVFEVGEGWHKGHDVREFFDVQGHGGLVGWARPAFLTDRDGERRRAVELLAADAVELIIGKPELHCRESSPVDMGGIEARSLTCEPETGEEVFGGKEGEFATTGGTILRISVFEVKGILMLGIAQVDPGGTEAYFDRADEICATVVFEA
jgi:hypothetical protein